MAMQCIETRSCANRFRLWLRDS